MRQSCNTVAAFFLVAVLVDRPNRFHSLLLNQVDIDVFCDFGVGVTQQFGNHFDFAPIVKKHCCEGVTQCMHTDFFEADGFEDLVEGSAKARRAYSRAI